MKPRGIILNGSTDAEPFEHVHSLLGKTVLDDHAVMPNMLTSKQL